MKQPFYHITLGVLMTLVLGSAVMANACPMNEDEESSSSVQVIRSDDWHPPTALELAADPADRWMRRWDAQRPECKELKIEYDSVGLCMNPNMDKALKMAGSKEYRQTVDRIFESAAT